MGLSPFKNYRMKRIKPRIRRILLLQMIRWGNIYHQRPIYSITPEEIHLSSFTVQLLPPTHWSPDADGIDGEPDGAVSGCGDFRQHDGRCQHCLLDGKQNMAHLHCVANATFCSSPVAFLRLLERCILACERAATRDETEIHFA